MTNQLTDKRFIVGLRGGYKIYVNEEQKESIIKALEISQTFIKHNGGIFRASEINYVLQADQIEKDEKIKKGDWQCSWGHWHQKFEQCGHNRDFPK